MAWYDLFAHTYDLQLEGLYAPHRQALVEALDLPLGADVLLVPVGTGQDLPHLVEAVGPDGRVLGLDLSAGMLRKAAGRAAAARWTNVHLTQADVCTLTADLVEETLGRGDVDAVVFTLGLTAFPDPDAAFAAAWDLLVPGGRVGILDVHANRRVPQTCVVEWMAGADLDRKVWEPLEAAAPDATRTVVADRPWTFGGELFVATGTRS